MVKISTEELQEQGLSKGCDFRKIMDFLSSSQEVSLAIENLGRENRFIDLGIVPLHVQEQYVHDGLQLTISVPDLEDLCDYDDYDGFFDDRNDNNEFTPEIFLVCFKDIDALLRYAKMTLHSAMVYKNDSKFYLIDRCLNEIECEFAASITQLSEAQVAHVEEMWEPFTDLSVLRAFN